VRSVTVVLCNDDAKHRAEGPRAWPSPSAAAAAVSALSSSRGWYRQSQSAYGVVIGQ